MENSLFKNHPAEDAPEAAKYHPLILQDSLCSRILAITEKIKSEQKHNYLQNLHDAFKDALKCDKCGCVLKAGSIEFTCQHKFCENCATKISSCSLCTKAGYNVGSTIRRDFSSLMNDIMKMKNNYNAESIVFYLVQFFIDPTRMGFSEEPTIRPTRNTASKTPRALSGVKNSAGKRIVAKSNKPSTSKRKLQLNKVASSSPPRTSEHDSESLFVCPNDKTVNSKKIVHSYLEQQNSILDSPAPKLGENTDCSPPDGKRKMLRRGVNVDTNFRENSKSYARNVKRKMLKCVNGDMTLSSPERSDANAEESNEGDGIPTAVLKRRKLDRPRGLENVNGGNKITAYVSVKKSRGKVFEEPCESASDSGFKDVDEAAVIQGNEEICDTNKNFRRKSSRISVRESLDENMKRQKNVNEPSTSEEISKIPLEATEKLENIEVSEQNTNDDPSRRSRRSRIKKLPEESSVKKISVKLGDVPETVHISVNEKQEDLARNEKSSNIKNSALKENANKQSTSVGTTEISIQKEKKTCRNTDADSGEDRTEKENLDANMSDYETEDVVDVKLWDRNDRQTRKKKLYKSLKERKKKNVLLKLLEEKRLQKEKRNQERFSEAESIDDVSRGTIVGEAIPPEKDRATSDLLVDASNTELILFQEEKFPENFDQKLPQSNNDRLMGTSNCDIDFKNSPSSGTDETKKSPCDVGPSSKSSPKSVPDAEEKCLFPINVTNTEQLSKDASVTVDEVKLEAIFTPSSGQTKFRYPTTGLKSDEHSISSPLANQLLVDVSSSAGYPNTSTPVLKKCENKNLDEALITENVNILSLDVGKQISSSQEAIIEYGEAVRNTIKEKCANLRRTINNQNQKLLVGLKKNFGVSSPQSLSIEKSKSKSPAVDRSFKDAHQINEKSRDSHEANSTIPVVEDDFSNTSTVPNSMTTREIACQTTSDLHIALLMQEFPHLFEKSNILSSVYDTPARSDVKCDNRSLSIIQTPEPPLVDRNIRAKYTAVSSVTSSEKKRVDTEFASRSILDTFRTPLGCISADASLTDLSSISPLPSSEKKPLESISQNSDKRRLSVRLNFQDGKKACSNGNYSALTSLKDEEIICSADVISCTEDSVAYSCKFEPSFTKNSQSAAGLASETDEKQRSLSNASKEVEFMDTNDEDEGQEMNKKIYERDQTVDEISTADPDFIPDSAVQIQDDVEVFEKADGSEIENMNGFRSPEKPDSDEDIDFVAGTPVCPDKRGTENSVEEMRTQNQVSKINASEAFTLDENSRLLFESNEYQISRSGESIRGYSIREASVENCSLANNPSVSYSTKIGCTSRSLDFSNMKSMIEEKIVCFTTSGLKALDLRLMDAFCEKFPVIMQDKLTDECTHLVVKTDSENRASRTFKYLQAIVNNVYIVSIHWVAECLRSGCIVKEENFVPLDSSDECGPLRAHNVAKGLTPSPLSWLSDYCILFKHPIPHGCTLSQLQVNSNRIFENEVTIELFAVPTFKTLKQKNYLLSQNPIHHLYSSHALTKSSNDVVTLFCVQEIVKKTGATVVNALNEMDAYPTLHHIVIISDDDEQIESITKNLKHWLQRYHAVAIEFNWLLETIGRNRLMPFVDHEFAEIPSDILRRLNFPAEMLQLDAETTI